MDRTREQHTAGSVRRRPSVHGSRHPEAGVTMLELLLAIVILSVLGLALYQSTLFGLRTNVRSQKRSELTHALQTATDWARAEACTLDARLVDALSEYVLPLPGQITATFRKADIAEMNAPEALPAALALIDVVLSAPGAATELNHRFMLYTGDCPQS